MTNNSPVGNDLRIRIVKRPFPKECESCVKSNYYTASYMSMQYETSCAACDWLPGWARWCNLASSGLPAMRRKKIVFFLHMTNLLLTKLVIFFVFIKHRLCLFP